MSFGVFNKSFFFILIAVVIVTYARGFKIVREKCSQKYNTSSADDQSAAANYRRKHPVLALKGERGFEKIFSKPSSKDVTVDQNMLEEIGIQLDKNSSESVVTNAVASADVHNMSNVGSKNLPERNSGSTFFEQRDCANKSTSRTTKPVSSQTEKGKKPQHKQSSSNNFSSENNVNAETVSRSSSIHSLNKTTKRSGESVSGRSRTRSRSSRSRSIRSLSRSSCLRSRSISLRTLSRSSDSISEKRLFTNHSNSKHGSQSSSDRIELNKSRHEKRPLKSNGRSDSNNLSLSSRAIVKENNKSSVASRHVDRSQQTLEHRKVPLESTRGQRLHSEINRSTHNSNVTKRSTHVAVSRSRSNSSIHSMYSNPRSCSSRSRSRDSPLNSRSGAHRKSEAECKLKRLLKLMEKCDQRQIEQDRRLNRFEVTMNKMFIMMGDLTNANNSQVQHRDVQMMSTREIDIESEDEIDEFDAPKLPVRHLDELYTLHKDLKDKRYRNFLVSDCVLLCLLLYFKSSTSIKRFISKSKVFYR